MTKIINFAGKKPKRRTFKEERKLSYSNNMSAKVLTQSNENKNNISKDRKHGRSESMVALRSKVST